MADKMFTVREFTKRGFVRRKDLDFSDDGNRFIGFEYDGMPITYLKADGMYYCSVRVDYLTNSFSYKKWMKVEEYKLAGEFNGCSSIDADKLVENIKAIKIAVDKLNAQVKEEAENVDIDRLSKIAAKEADYVEQIVEEFKIDFDWFNANSWVLDRCISYAKHLTRKIEIIREVNWETMDKIAAYNKMESYNDNGYLYIKSDDYYIKYLLEALKH